MGTKSVSFIGIGIGALLIVLSFLAILNHSWLMSLVFYIFGSLTVLVASVWPVVANTKKMSMSIFCNKCTNENPKSNKFCSSCGTELSTIQRKMVSFPQAIKSAFKGYFEFWGRSTRAEFFWFYLFYVLGVIICFLINVAILNTENSLISSIFILGCLLPYISLMVRRLHDLGMSGWVLLWLFIPFVGYIFLLALFCGKGQNGNNQYGPDPRQVGSELE